MTYTETLVNASEKMQLLNNEDGNWDLKFCFENGKASIYYIAKDPSQCGSGYFGDAAYVKRLMKSQTVDGKSMFDKDSLTFCGRVLLEANGSQKLYEKLLADRSVQNAV